MPKLDNKARQALSLCTQQLFHQLGQQTQQILHQRAREGDLPLVKGLLTASRYDPDFLYPLLTAKVTMQWRNRAGEVNDYTDTLFQLARRMIDLVMIDTIASALVLIDPALKQKQHQDFKGKPSFDCFDELLEAYGALKADPRNTDKWPVDVGGAWKRAWENMAWLMHSLHNLNSGWDKKKINPQFARDVKAVKSYLSTIPFYGCGKLGVTNGWAPLPWLASACERACHLASDQRGTGCSNGRCHYTRPRSCR